MSYQVENTQEELDLLRGAKIVSVDIRPVAGEDDDEEFKAFAGDDKKIVMSVVLPRMLHYLDPEGKEVTTRKATFEVWQDEEGNGPGYLAFTGGR